MPRFRGISLQTLKDRLGPEASKRWASGGAYSLWWSCSGAAGQWCIAHARADYRQMPPNLDAWEQEMFDTFPFPKEGWTLNPCPEHRDLFTDYPEEAE